MSLPISAISHLTGGIWLSASPWVLGYASDHTAWLTELVTGAALVALCASAAVVGSSSMRAPGTRAARRSGASAVAAKTVGAGS